MDFYPFYSEEVARKVTETGKEILKKMMEQFHL